MLECGPKCVGTADPVMGTRNLVDGIRKSFGLETKVLVYEREPDLAHTNHNVGGMYIDVENVFNFYRLLNMNGFPFNLAINGSPDYSRHVPFNNREIEYLGMLQDSGTGNSLRNAVTIADNALLPALRQQFTGLDVIASCISACYEPNLADFSREHGVSYEDPEFLVKYYRHLYSIYDMVVPVPQLANPGFFSALDLANRTLTAKTVVFLNLGCGSHYIGKCIEHYKGKRETTMPGMPVIYERYMSKPEDKDGSRQIHCSSASNAMELMHRAADLRALLEMGINKYKIPARSCDAKDVADFLCRFITQKPSPSAFPERLSLWGYKIADIKSSLIENYPESVHGVLRDFEWPPYDAGVVGAYCGNTAGSIQKKLHKLAFEAYNQKMGNIN